MTRKRRTVLTVLMAATMFLLMQGNLVFGASWHDVYLKDGQTYDIGDAAANTTVYINDSGTFTLKGQSSKVRVVINSKDATVYLADGLKMTPGALANVGQRTASIEVADNGGTVRLITKKNAKTSFGSYFGMPAILKEGVKTKLIFDTEDPKNPGTLTAKAAAFSSSPGIGSSGKGIVARNVWTGNMEFNGGIVYAYGAGQAAGIGGCSVGHVQGITVNGGEMIAEGGNKGAGIGGGYRGHGRDLFFYGGSVKAYGGESAAGIGTGASDGEHGQHPIAQNIIVDGGTVYAEGDGCGAGIGGGYESDANKIHVYSGSVTAIGGDISGTGIGGGAGNFFGTGSDIKISGGLVHVTVEDDATAIGSSSTGDGETSVTITGGNVTTNSGKNSVGIGGGGAGSVNGDYGTTTVAISGGTVLINGDTALDIGSRRNSDSFVYITGGSVKADTVTGLPTDGRGNTVYKTTITLDGMKWSQQVTQTEIAEHTGRTIDYGLSDIYTDVDKLYFWLPKDSKVKQVMVKEKDNPLYEGEVAASAAGTLYLPDPEVITYQIHYDANEPAGTMSIAEGEVKPQQVSGSQTVQLRQNNFTLKGYTFDGWNTKADGTGTGYLEGESVKDLAADNGAAVTLYAQWNPKTYAIHFDAGEGTGQMDTQEMIFDETDTLHSNAFTSPAGMRFAGWKQGELFYSDRQEVVNLCGYNEENNQLVPCTLEAQWVRDDQAVVQFTLDDKPYGLEDTDVVEARSADGAVKYSFSKIETGIYGCDLSLMAEGVYDIYLNDEKIPGKTMTVGTEAPLLQIPYYTVTVLCDENLHQPSVSRSPVLAGSLTTISVKEKPDSGYMFDRWTIIEGSPVFGEGTEDMAETEILILGKTAVKGISVQEQYRVEYDANKPEKTEEDVSGTMKAQSIPVSGAKLTKNSFVLRGYTFDGWNTKADGTGTAYEDEAQAVLAGETGDVITLYAQWKANIYTIIYEPNWGDGVMDVQKCYFDTPVVIRDNLFVRENYHFTGWNTVFDGSGSGFEEGAEAKNLSTVPYDMTYLYAQWVHDSYRVSYDANGGQGYMPADDVWTATEYYLLGCGFGREGYLFKGWNTSADGSGTAYGEHAAVKDIGEPGETIVLYAQWEKALPQPGQDDADEESSEKQPGAKDQDPDNKTPLTGDSGGLELYIAMLLLAAVTISILLKKEKNGKV